jgi:pimeloyl-ACP methyl ester carboxylesterase
MAEPQRSRADLVRRVARAVRRAPGIGILFAPPRTASFAVSSLVRRHLRVTGDVPTPRLTAALTAQVALDEALIGVMKSPRRYPTEADYARIAAELRSALALAERRGWTEHPSRYHRTPPPLEAPTVRRSWALGLAYERLSWPSGYEPHEGEPGARRWLARRANRTAHAWLVRGRPGAPWLVCVHGFGTGYPTADFVAFKARRLLERHGLTLLFPVLPLHGPRRASRLGGIELVSHHVQEFVFGMAQAAWDIRRLLGWARSQGARRIGVYGMSLGAYVAALLAALEDGLDLVVAGAPVSDMPALLEHHSPASVLRRARAAGIDPEAVRRLHRVVSPLARPPLLSPERLAIYAGTGDRMAPPEQARLLWQRWGEPSILWYEGSHLALLWSAAVRAFLDQALDELAG